MHQTHVRYLQGLGLTIGDRDPRRNTAFNGKFMVAAPIAEHLLPTECARDAYCIVGDDIYALIATATAHFA